MVGMEIRHCCEISGARLFFWGVDRKTGGGNWMGRTRRSRAHQSFFLGEGNLGHG